MSSHKRKDAQLKWKRRAQKLCKSLDKRNITLKVQFNRFCFLNTKKFFWPALVEVPVSKEIPYTTDTGVVFESHDNTHKDQKSQCTHQAAQIVF